jgi:NAD(P)-dependent dehydrogenase (short-subunit alcohol dehydrogenase family)
VPDGDTHDDLSGQVALVTGATRGIGAETARQLADRGATVYAGARDTDDVDAPDVTGDLRPLELDVTDDEGVAAAFDRVAADTGRLDALVNNAGVFHRADSLAAMEMATFDHTMAVNLRGPVVVTKHALPLLLETEAPRVVTLSSGLGRFTDGGMGDGYPAYRLSKVGVGGLTASLDGEYGGAGLLASAVDPGWVATDMGGDGAPRSVAEGAATPVHCARLRPGSPAGRLWKDREVVSW